MHPKLLTRIILSLVLVAHLWFAAAYSLIAMAIDNWAWLHDAQLPHFVLTLFITIAGSVFTMTGIVDRWRKPTAPPVQVTQHDGRR